MFKTPSKIPSSIKDREVSKVLQSIRDDMDRLLRSLPNNTEVINDTVKSGQTKSYTFRSKVKSVAVTSPYLTSYSVTLKGRIFNINFNGSKDNFPVDIIVIGE